MDFGRDFLWGSATSSFQIEGGFDLDGRGVSIWDEFCKYPNKVMRQHSGEFACDHRRRFKEDVQIMKSLGLKAYRFSIAWPRVIPNGTGEVSQSGLDFYSDLVDELLASDITPWVTLFHWDLPWELHLRGGWLNPDISKSFEDYTKVVVDRLGDRVKNWMTINEPQVIIGMGYASGEFAPGVKLSLKELLISSKNLLLSHGRAAKVLRENCSSDTQIGWAPVGILYQPQSESEADIEAARQATFHVNKPSTHGSEELHRCLWNSSWWMDPVYLGEYPEIGLKHFESFLPDNFTDGLDIIHQRGDFFAANIYHAMFAATDDKNGFKVVEPDNNMGSNSMGWDIVPDSLYWAARYYNERYDLPVYYTENGIPQTDLVVNDRVQDPNRIEFIRSYLSGVKRGISEGLPIHGYFYWSLLDNFEWASGYKQRFGIVHVDYNTQKRIIKDSGHWYKDVIKSNGDLI